MTPNRVARVIVTVPGGQSIGSAFPVARHQPSPKAAWQTLLLTARHVVYVNHEDPGTPVNIGLDFPGATDDGLYSAPTEARVPKPFLATLVIDGAARLGAAPNFSDDWVLIAAELPAVVDPFPWGIFEPEEAWQPDFEGAGYPTGALNTYSFVRGQITGSSGIGTDAVLMMSVDASDGGNVDPTGFSGGPMAIGNVAVGLFTRSIMLPSPIAGKAEVAGTRRARPLQPIMEEVAKRFAFLGTPRPLRVVRRGPPTLEDQNLDALCLAAQQVAANAASAGTLEALDEACAVVVNALPPPLPPNVVPAKTHTFVRAVQQLLVYPITGAQSYLVRVLRTLGNNEPAILARFGALLPDLDGAVATVSAALQGATVESTAVVIDITWAAPQDRKNVRITLRERRGGRYPSGESREAPADPSAVIAACESLLQPQFGRLGVACPVEVWTPVELADFPFDQAMLDSGEDRYAVGVLAPVTVRIRWTAGSDKFPPDIVRARATGLAGLMVPLQELPGPLSEFPPDDTSSLLLDGSTADARKWRTWARNRGNLLVVVIATPPPSGSTSTLAGAIVRGGVPVVAWARGSGAPLVTLFKPGAAAPQPIGRRMMDYRNDNNDNRENDFTIVLSPPGEPVPTDDLLFTLSP